MSGGARTVLAAALAYRARGWCVLPTQRDKRPHAPALAATSGSNRWSRLRGEPATKEEISEWYTRFPEAGVGILTGQPSGLVVVDFDRPFPSGVRLAETPIAQTGRGLHIYYGSDAVLSGKRVAFGDLKAEGGYVVAPPSVHPTGKAYRWLIAPEGLGTLAVPEAALADFAEFEQWRDRESHSSDERAQETGVDIYSCVSPSLDALLEGDNDDPDLASWDRDPTFVDAARALLGIPPGELGRAFRCVLPGHEERRPSASLFVEPRRQTVVYRDWHTGVWYTLTDVYAAQISGQARKLRGPEHARWKLRLLVELGFLSPAHVVMPPLPADAPACARAVYDGLQVLLACRWAREPGEPTPFTAEFGAAWCGLSRSQFERGKSWLIDRKLIQPAGAYGRMRLWLPGESEAA